MSRTNEERATMSAPGSTLEDLQNDAEALAMALRLAEYGAECSEKFHARFGTPGEERDDYPAAETVARLYADGAAGRDPDALVAWLKERIAETQNAIAALDGTATEIIAKPSAKYVDVVLTYSGRVPKADLQQEFECDDLTDTDTQTRLSIEMVRQWVNDGDCFEHDPQVTHTDEE